MWVNHVNSKLVLGVFKVLISVPLAFPGDFQHRSLLYPKKAISEKKGKDTVTHTQVTDCSALRNEKDLFCGTLTEMKVIQGHSTRHVLTQNSLCQEVEFLIWPARIWTGCGRFDHLNPVVVLCMFRLESKTTSHLNLMFSRVLSLHKRSAGFSDDDNGYKKMG